MSRRHKYRTITFLWIALTVSAFLTRERLWIPVLLAGVGIGVTIHILTLQPNVRERADEDCDRPEQPENATDREQETANRNSDQKSL